jgi:hypothetical protein
MGYYQGDFYAGARGDPFWGALVGLARKGIGALVGATRGRGPVVETGTGGIPAALGVMSAGRAIIKRGTAQIIKHPVLSAAGAAAVTGAAVGVGGRMLAEPSALHRGFHISRKTGKLVRNRHMNPCNPRALRRAIRRATRFTRLAMKTIHLVHPKKKGRFGGFRKRKRAA